MSGNEVMSEIDSLFDEIQELLKSLSNFDGLSEKINSISKSEVMAKKDITDFFKDPSMSSSMIAIASVENFNAKIIQLQSYLSLKKIKKNLQTNSIISYIVNIVKTISTCLWQLILKKLNLKSWSISGGIAGNLFGVASGSMQLQLTFE